MTLLIIALLGQVSCELRIRFPGQVSGVETWTTTEKKINPGLDEDLRSSYATAADEEMDHSRGHQYC